MSKPLKKLILLNDTSFELHHGSREVISNLKSLLIAFGFKLIATCPVGRDWQKKLFLKKAIDNADLVLVNGEGSIHHEQPTGRILAAIAPYARKRNIPVVLINTTYQNNGDDIAELMRSFNLIFVRETFSKIELERYGIFSTVVPDLTFYSHVPVSPVSNPKNIVGYTDSASDNLSTQLYDLFKNKQWASFLPIIAGSQLDRRRFIRSLVKTTLFNLDAYRSRRKNNLNRQLTLREANLCRAVTNTELYKKALSNLQCLITARYHALCFAVQLRIPFLTIKANSYKMEGLLEDIQLNKKRFVFSLNFPNDPDFYKSLAFTRDENIKIDAYILQARSRIIDMFTQIRELVDK